MVVPGIAKIIPIHFIHVLLPRDMIVLIIYVLNAQIQSVDNATMIIKTIVRVVFRIIVLIVIKFVSHALIHFA